MEKTELVDVYCPECGKSDTRNAVTYTVLKLDQAEIWRPIEARCVGKRHSIPVDGIPDREFPKTGWGM